MEMIPWLTVLALGAYHGLNPGMGWLFAVALGLQERRRSAVVRALGPIAIGHAVSVLLVVSVVGAVGMLVPAKWVQWACASVILAFGVYKLLAPMSHPRWVGMRVHGRDLATWSFLMATAHGAGLMLIPVVLRSDDHEASARAMAGHEHHAAAMAETASSASSLPFDGVVTVAVHSGVMFLVMGVVALVVFEKLGLTMLRTRWLNVDRIWAGALALTGLITFLL